MHLTLQNIRAVIIDDEQKAAQALQTLLTEFCEGVEVVAIAHDVPNGYKMIQQHKPDVVFLDVELPGAVGFSLLDYFDKIDFEIIFATAYNQYALKAFECSALDYLLKPVEIKKLRISLEKLRQKKELSQIQEKYNTLKDNIQKHKIAKIGLPTSEGLVFVKIEDVIRCEGENNYTTFFMNNNTKIVISRTLKDYEDLLADSGFFRPHKSHLINLDHVKKFIRTKASQLIMDDGSVVEVSVRKKEALSQILPSL
jgi:two-component system, LytTR family, response regulator